MRSNARCRISSILDKFDNETVVCDDKVVSVAQRKMKDMGIVAGGSTEVRVRTSSETSELSAPPPSKRRRIVSGTVRELTESLSGLDLKCPSNHECVIM